MRQQRCSRLFSTLFFAAVAALLVDHGPLPATIIGGLTSDCTDVEYVELLFPALTDSMVLYVNGTFLCKSGRCGPDNLAVTGDLRVNDGRTIQTYTIPFDVRAGTPPDDSYGALSAVVDLTALGVDFGGGVGNASLSVAANIAGMSTFSARAGIRPEPFMPSDAGRTYSVGISVPRMVPVR